MKRISIGTMIACLMLAACEVIGPVEDKDIVESVSDGTCAVADSIIFTATLGGQTKTYLEFNGYSYKTLWDEDDKILLWDASCMNEERPDAYEFVKIRNGAGTAKAEFLATLKADSYIALYAHDYAYPIDGRPAIDLRTTQYMWTSYGETTVGPYYYPMIAVTDDNNLEFQNLCSILKVRVTGNGEILETVTVSAPNGEPISGAATIYKDGTDYCLDFLGEDDGYSVYSSVDYHTEEVLSDKPVDCLIVIPAQVYVGGLEIIVTTNEGTRKVSTGKQLTLQRSKFYDVSVEFSTELSFMKGTYTATADNYWNGPVTWIIGINYTEQDSRKVWFDNLFQKDNWVHSSTRFYGILSDDETTLSIPFGQTSEYVYSNGFPIMLLGFDGQAGTDVGTLEASIVRNGNNVTIDFGDNYGFWFLVSGDDGGNLNILNPGITAVKD